MVDYRRMVLAVVAVATFAASASAQLKPMGAYYVHPSECWTRPSWITVSTINSASTQLFEEAAACSEATGMRWVMLLGETGRTTFDLARDTGLWPHIAAVTYGEEWYAHTRTGLYDGTPLVNGVRYREDPWRALEGMHHYLSMSYTAVASIWNRPVLHVDHFVNDRRVFGPDWWAPAPRGTSALGLDIYVTAGQRFDDFASYVLAYAVQTTTLPLVLIPQFFDSDLAPMTADILEGNARWLAHPRVVGALGYAWSLADGTSCEAVLTSPRFSCLRDMPDTLTAIQSYADAINTRVAARRQN